jgi:hypothetical protein
MEYIRRSCEQALWRVEWLLSRLEEGESLNTSSTAPFNSRCPGGSAAGAARHRE